MQQSPCLTGRFRCCGSAEVMCCLWRMVFAISASMVDFVLREGFARFSSEFFIERLYNHRDDVFETLYETRKGRLMNEQDMLLAWYLYAANVDGFIGAALRRHRVQMALTELQQRELLGIAGGSCDHLWLRLQALVLPGAEHLQEHLERIAASLTSEGSIVLNKARLEEFLQGGSGEDRLMG